MFFLMKDLTRQRKACSSWAYFAHIFITFLTYVMCQEIFEKLELSAKLAFIPTKRGERKLFYLFVDFVLKYILT